MINQILLVQREIEKREKQRDFYFLLLCCAVGGANLASGSLVGWAVCTGIGLLPYLRR